jgi:hypothetical protein
LSTQHLEELRFLAPALADLMRTSGASVGAGDA